MKKKKPKARKRKRSRLSSSRRRPSSVSKSVPSPGMNQEEKFGFISGSYFTLEEFEKYARYFKDSYFESKDNVGDAKWAPSVEEIEGEYWRIVEQPTDEVEVHNIFLWSLLTN